jgi:hypothetical protein
MDSKEVARIGWVKLQFLPKFEDLVVDAAGGWIVVVSPDIGEQLFARNDALSVLEKEAEQFELMGSEADVLIVLANQHAGKVDLALAKTNRCIESVLLIFLIQMI